MNETLTATDSGAFSWLSPWGRRWYPRALAAAVLMAVTVSVLAADGASTPAGRLGGDFPAFYGAGRIVAAGDGADLYSAERQHLAQAELLPGEGGGFLYFAYPPVVAAAYRPLAALEYRWAYAVHTAAMAAALVGALALLRSRVPLLQRHFLAGVVAALALYPMLAAVTGGQNTALMLLLLAASWRAAEAHREVTAGVFAGLALYKPQFGLPIIGLYALSGRWRIVAGAGLAGAGLYLAGAVVQGAGWPAVWWERAVGFAGLDQQVNAANGVSFPNFFGGGELAVLGWVLAAVVAAGLARLWWRPRLDLTARMTVTIPGVLLLSPHTQFYDAGLLVLPLALLTATAVTAAGWWAPVWGAAAAHGAAPLLGASPVILAVILTAAWALRAALTQEVSP